MEHPDGRAGRPAAPRAPRRLEHPGERPHVADQDLLAADLDDAVVFEHAESAADDLADASDERSEVLLGDGARDEDPFGCRLAFFARAHIKVAGHSLLHGLEADLLDKLGERAEPPGEVPEQPHGNVGVAIDDAAEGASRDEDDLALFERFDARGVRPSVEDGYLAEGVAGVKQPHDLFAAVGTGAEEPCAAAEQLEEAAARFTFDSDELAGLEGADNQLGGQALGFGQRKRRQVRDLEHVVRGEVHRARVCTRRRYRSALVMNVTVWQRGRSQCVAMAEFESGAPEGPVGSSRAVGPTGPKNQHKGPYKKSRNTTNLQPGSAEEKDVAPEHGQEAAADERHGRPRRSHGEGLEDIIGPAVVAIRGPSRSGKTALSERLVLALSARGLRVAWLKRTHHAVDLPGKSSGRVWAAGPAATALRAGDRLQVTLPPGSTDPEAMLAVLPGDLDVVLLETHEPALFPTILSSRLTPAEGEDVIGRWDFLGEDAAAAALAPLVAARVPADRALDNAMRAALRLHGGHGCAGLVLGTRLALAGAQALDVAVPDTKKRLIVTSETDRCAVDGIQAVTGCRPGKRTLRLLDFGKLAATFYDEWAGRAVRVSARGDLRDRVGATGEDRHKVQRLAYARWPHEELFAIAEVPFAISQYDRPGPPRARVICTDCAEEVSDGRHIDTESGPRCRPCVAAGAPERGSLS